MNRIRWLSNNSFDISKLSTIKTNYMWFVWCLIFFSWWMMIEANVVFSFCQKKKIQIHQPNVVCVCESDNFCAAAYPQWWKKESCEFQREPNHYHMKQFVVMRCRYTFFKHYVIHFYNKFTIKFHVWVCVWSTPHKYHQRINQTIISVIYLTKLNKYRYKW